MRKNDVEALRIMSRARRWDTGIRWVGIVFSILALGIPALILRSTVEAFAGKTTKVDISIAIAVTVGMTIVAGVEATHNKYLRSQLRERDKEIRRLKDRLDKVDQKADSQTG